MNVETTMVQHSNPFLNAQRQLLTAVEQLGLDRAVYEVLKEPERVIIVSIPVRMDDGSLRTFTGYRAQHTLVTGPAKGGIRFHPDVTLDRSEEHTSELQSRENLVCRLLLEKKKKQAPAHDRG